MTKDVDENYVIAERRRKLEAMREEGGAFPNDFRRDALAADLHGLYEHRETESLEKEAIRVSVAGRMMAKRVMGKASFAQLQDSSGRIQIYVQREVIGQDAYKAFKAYDLGDIVGAEGTLFRTRTGELSIRAERLVLLTKSLRPLPEKYHGLTDTEQRYRRRYLDLIMSPESRDVFRARTEIVRVMREFLDSLGFMEVETPMMQSIPGGALARPFVTHHHALDMQLYLRVAPELFLKRLVVGGFEKVYEINRNFRNEGVSTRHNPEFSMLELYQAYADYEDIMALTETLVRDLATAMGDPTAVNYQGESLDLKADFRRITLADSLLERVEGLEAERLRDVDYMRAVCEQHQVPVEDAWGAGKLQLELYEKMVEHSLREPTFVTHYPKEVSPLSRETDGDPFLTDRFELIVAGREIANGFSELNDPEEQARRFREQVTQKQAGDEEAMPFDQDYIEALEYGMPPTGGLGIGVDRLVMLLTDAASIRDVLLFPLMRPEG